MTNHKTRMNISMFFRPFGLMISNILFVGGKNSSKIRKSVIVTDILTYSIGLKWDEGKRLWRHQRLCIPAKKEL